jgi:hypothetical protein
MFIQYQQQCCAYVQSIVHVTKRYGGMVVFLSRIEKYACLNLGPEIGDFGWGFVELPLFLKEDAKKKCKRRVCPLSPRIFYRIHWQKICHSIHVTYSKECEVRSPAVCVNYEGFFC